MPDLGVLLNQIFGNYPTELAVEQIAIRAVFIYLVTLAMVQLGHNKRFTGQFAAFDIILGIMLGSILSRTVNGSAPLWETLLAGLLLVVFHWLFARLAYYSHAIGLVVKGRSRQLINNGDLNEENMRREAISRRDLQEALRREGVQDFDEVKAAYSERNGAISIIRKSDKAQVLSCSVDVQDGVQKVELVVRMVQGTDAS